MEFNRIDSYLDSSRAKELAALGKWDEAWAAASRDPEQHGNCHEQWVSGMKELLRQEVTSAEVRITCVDTDPEVVSYELEGHPHGIYRVTMERGAAEDCEVNIYQGFARLYPLPWKGSIEDTLGLTPLRQLKAG